MSRAFDQASADESAFREAALGDQRKRSGLEGKTEADSATHCERCEARIPNARRKAYPGTQKCVSCQRVEELRRTRF